MGRRARRKYPDRGFKRPQRVIKGDAGFPPVDQAGKNFTSVAPYPPLLQISISNQHVSDRKALSDLMPKNRECYQTPYSIN
jgi:hypothetical protein